MKHKKHVSVLVSSSSHIFSEGIDAILGAEPGIEVLRDCGDLRMIPQKVRRLHPDVLVADLSKQGNKVLAAMREAKRVYPKVKILVLAISGSLNISRKNRNSGLFTFLHPRTKLGDLLQMIQAPEEAATKPEAAHSHSAIRRGPSKHAKPAYRLKLTA